MFRLFLLHINFYIIISGENVERDAVQKSLMLLLRQDVKSKFVEYGGLQQVERRMVP